MGKMRVTTKPLVPYAPCRAPLPAPRARRPPTPIHALPPLLRSLSTLFFESEPTSDPTIPPPFLARRSALALFVATRLLTPDTPPPAHAGEMGDLIPQLPLPPGYTRATRRLIKALRESLEAELEGAGEFEIRKKADPVKDLVKVFLQASDGVDDVSKTSVLAALTDLSNYYKKAGPRAALTADVARTILDRLDAAENALPEEKGKSLFGVPL